MDDLVEFLRTRLDEDEQAARAAAERIGPTWGTQVKWVPDIDAIPDAEWDNELGLPRNAVGFYGTEAEHEHLKRWTPARVLRDIEAKRGVVARYEFACREAAQPGISEEERETRVQVGGALQSCVLCLAAPYVDHPDYREEWRP